MNAGKEYIAPPRFWFVVYRRDERDERDEDLNVEVGGQEI
jgi:hypothetical protein